MRKTLRVRPAAYLCAAVAASICLGACGSGSHTDSAAALLHGKAKDKPRATPVVIDPTADMGAAVSASKGLFPVSVKFQINDKPQPGQPVNVDFALVPDEAVLSLAAKFDGDEGLSLVGGEQVQTVEKPAPRMPIHHVVTVLPKADGIYTVTVTVTVATDGDSRTHAFSIPVIAGDGLSQLTAQGDPPKVRP